ncbi:MAG: hypothetical protein ACI898_000064 [Flavobacteriales bacterium]|jgi:hypothetical protein
MKTKYKFSEGFSLSYIAHAGLILFISAVLAAIFNGYLLLIGCVLIIMLLLITTGVKLDLEAKTFSTYKSVFSKDFDKTIDLTAFKTGRLVFTNERDTFSTTIQVRSLASRTFDLVLFKADGKKTHIYEFQDYKTARKITDLLRQHMSIITYDEWGERAASASRNQNRRR